MRALLPSLTLTMTLIMALLLSACSVLPTSTPLRTFTLTNAPTESSNGESESAAVPALPLTLRVDTPNANTPLDGIRILIQPSAQELKVYAGARWRDSAPVLLQEHLISALRQDGRLNAVIDDSSHARDDILLSTQLAGFHSRYQQHGPETVIELDAQLINTRQGHVLASQHFSINQPADNENIEAIVAAFGKAAERLDRQVVDWTLLQLNETTQPL